MWPILLTCVAGLLVVWLALVLALLIAGRRETEPVRLRDGLRLIPDIVRLMRGIATDKTVPRGVRIRLGALLAYLVFPIDLIPDFLPVIGYADDVILVVIAIRSVARRAGVEVIDRHWSGTPAGLAAVKRLAGLDTAN